MANIRRDMQKDPIYYHFILSDRELFDRIDGEFFAKSPIQPLYELARKHALKYGAAPKKQDIMDMVDSIDMDEEEKSIKYDKTRIEVIYSRSGDVARYSEDLLRDEIKTYCSWMSLGDALESGVAEYRLRQEEVTPDNVEYAIASVYDKLSRSNVITFEEDNPGADFWDLNSHEAVEIEHWTTGHPYLDYCLDGGFYAGSLHVFMGAPKVGKSMWLCDLAAKSVQNGIDCAYVSLEMDVATVYKRVCPNILSIPKSKYEYLIKNDKEELGRVMMNRAKSFAGEHRGEFFAIALPTGEATAARIADILKKKEQQYSEKLHREFKFKNIFVDYLAIARSSLKDQSNLYLNGKKTAEEFRAQARINNWCVISASQANKSQYGSSDIDETQVAESSGLNATVDSMFGIIKDSAMGAAGIYRLKCIYDRILGCQGKSKTFMFADEYFRMDETVGDIISDSESTTFEAAIRNEASIKNSTFSKKLMQQSLGGDMLRTGEAVSVGVPINLNITRSAPKPVESTTIRASIQPLETTPVVTESPVASVDTTMYATDTGKVVASVEYKRNPIVDVSANVSVPGRMTISETRRGTVMERLTKRNMYLKQAKE